MASKTCLHLDSCARLPEYQRTWPPAYLQALHDHLLPRAFSLAETLGTAHAHAHCAARALLWQHQGTPKLAACIALQRARGVCIGDVALFQITTTTLPMVTAPGK